MLPLPHQIGDLKKVLSPLRGGDVSPGLKSHVCGRYRFIDERSVRVALGKYADGLILFRRIVARKFRIERDLFAADYYRVFPPKLAAYLLDRRTHRVSILAL